MDNFEKFCNDKIELYQNMKQIMEAREIWMYERATELGREVNEEFEEEFEEEFRLAWNDAITKRK